MKTKLFLITVLPLFSALGCVHPGQSARTSDIPKPIPIESLTPKALEILKNGLNDQNSFIRTMAVEIAANSGQKQFLPDIIKHTDDPIVTVRFAAVASLGDWLCRSCQQILQKKLKDENPNVRLAAAYALTKIGAGGYQDLIREAMDSPDPTVAANAVLLLGKLGSRDDIARFYELLGDTDTPDKVRFQALESIARLGDIRAYRNKIWPLLISKYHDDRVWGIRCMGLLDTPEAKTAIQTMLEDDVLEVRLTAAEQLGRLGDRSGTEIVRDYLDQQANLNETTMANQMAVAAIGTIGSPSLYAYLPEALRSHSPIIRLIGAQSVLWETE